MKAPREPSSKYEGLLVVEFVNDFGRHSVAALSDAEVTKLAEQKPRCGECCHPSSHEEQEAFFVVGRVRRGRVYRDGDDPVGRPIRDWFPYVVDAEEKAS